MTCSNPDHAGLIACTKTRSSAIAGEETALRLLKMWALHGVSAESKAKHSKEVWKTVLEMERLGFLPSTEELDANAITDWSDLPEMCLALAALHE